FQSFNLFPHMTVRENIRFGLDAKRTPSAEAEKLVKEAIAVVQMDKFADRKPNELSGGQQQRVALARALVVRPNCLLLDEPLSNLDSKLRLEMRTEIRRICRSSGLTAVYVTHDQKEALSIADRMAVLNHGKIEQLGRPQDMYLHPQNKFVANFMGETNFIEATVIDSNPKTTRVKTPFGTLVSEWAPKTFAPGSKVTISIRPESVRMGPVVSPNQRNVFDATLSDTIYLGEVAQHIIHVNNNGSGTETTFRAFEMNPKFVARDGVVQAVRISLDPTDVVILVD
ncbi:MAG TPA: ABC transporter ATP-binding protein, partial [Tepidisphaeraceae bacterium]|nr:ABC transporter ATP-binding protein [Tepidisphaeraceae bacterium]